MTVNTTEITSGPYNGNDVTDEFDYDFRIESNTQVAVYERVGTGVPTLLTLTTDYTVAGLGDDDGGTITRVAGALPSGSKWYIRSNYAETQLTAFPSQGGFFPDVHEAVTDKLTFLIQQIEDKTGRSIKLADFDESAETANMTIPDLETRISQYLGFDASGNLITIAGVAGEVIVSSFMETLLDDTTAADARTTLGAVGLTGAETITDVKTFTGHIAIEQATPRLELHESDGAADNQIWELIIVGEQLRLRVTNDDRDIFGDVFIATRTDTTVDLFNILSTALQHNGVDLLTTDTGVQVDGTDEIKTKIIDIGPWNMDTSTAISVPHGLTLSSIRPGVSGSVRNDAATALFESMGFSNADASPVELYISAIDATNITIRKRVGGFFDGDVNYNAISNIIDNDSAIDKGSGLVGIPITSNTFAAHDITTISGTVNYDSSYKIVSRTTNEIVIEAAYVAETFDGTDLASWSRGWIVITYIA